ncbi:MAG: O-antigen ligase family protein [Caldilineaceae bacterium]|nr:O-antigen ligase family protein [Caldilineaceae bacterium]
MIQNWEQRLPWLIAGAVGLSELAFVGYGLWISYPDINEVTKMLALSALGILGVLLFLYLPEIGVGLYLFNGIFKTADIFGDAESIIPTLFILGLTIGILAVRTPATTRISLRMDPLLGLLLGFNGLVFLSALFTGMPGALEKSLRLTFFTSMSLLMAQLILQSPQLLLQAFRYTALLAVITAVMSVATFMLDSGGSLRSVTLFAANDVVFGRTLATGILMSFGLFLYDQTLPKIWRWFLLLSLPITLMSLILSTSRGATVGLIGTLLFALFLHRRRPPLWVFGVIGFGVLAYFYITTTWGDRVIDLVNFSFYNYATGLDLSTQLRVNMYIDAIQRYLTHPLFGIGTQPNGRYPHNIFLEVASELGTVGLLLFLGLAWQIWNKMRLLLRQPADSVSYILAQITAIGLVYSLIIAQFSGNFQHQRSLWLFLAIAWALQPASRLFYAGPSSSDQPR